MMRTLLFPVLSGLLLTACDQVTELTPFEAETPPIEAAEAEPEAAPSAEQQGPSRTAAERKTATIDWNAARADFAARDSDDGGMAQVASGGSPAVPILLPDEPVGVASAGGEDA